MVLIFEKFLENIWLVAFFIVTLHAIYYKFNLYEINQISSSLHATQHIAYFLFQR